MFDLCFHLVQGEQNTGVAGGAKIWLAFRIAG
jgi:hypothetical protein